MTLAEAIETTRIHCIAGRTGGRTAFVTACPFRAPITPSPMSGRSAAATYRCRAKCRQIPTASSSWMNGPSSGASHSENVSFEHTLPHVIDLVAVLALAKWSQATTV
jgi:hypothetical protein